MQGFLEVRGGSQRVCHYRGIVNGQRLYERHSVGNNGNQSLGINRSLETVMEKPLMWLKSRNKAKK